MKRRDLLKCLLVTPLAATVDLEKLLWVPKPIISVPSTYSSVYDVMLDQYVKIEYSLDAVDCLTFRSTDRTIRPGRIVTVNFNGDKLFQGTVQRVIHTDKSIECVAYDLSSRPLYPSDAYILYPPENK